MGLQISPIVGGGSGAGYWNRVGTLLTTRYSGDDASIGGKLGIGFETVPSYALHIVGTNDDSTTGVILRYENTATGAMFALISSRGTPGSPAATEDGDDLGSFLFGGYDSTDIKTPVAIMTEATEDWNATSWGSKMKIGVTPAGTTGMITAIEIEDYGECKFYDDIRLSDGQKLYGNIDANISVEAGDGGATNDGGTLRLRSGSYGAGGSNAGDIEVVIGGSDWHAKYSQNDFGGYFGYSQRNTQTRHYYNRDAQNGGDSDWYYEFRRSRGSYGSPTLVADDDYLGEINFRGYDGSNYIEGAYIRAEIDGTPGATDLPTSLIFATTADGDSSATEAIRIDPSQNVGIGTDTPTSRLSVSDARGGVTLDSELVINGNFTGNANGWTLGLGGGTPDWFYDTDKVSHADGGGVAVLEPSTPLTLDAGENYLIVFILSDVTAGYIVASMAGTATEKIYTNAVYAFIAGGATTNLAITPSDTFVGTIDDISVLKILTELNVLQTLTGTGGTDYSMEMRIGSIGNFYLGSEAGRFDKGDWTDGKSIGIGNEALRDSVYGFENIAIGNSALQVNVTGSRNTAIGVESLEGNLIGGGNTAIGEQTLQFNTSGNQNTAVGYLALGKLSSGSNNTAVGYKAGQIALGGTFSLIKGDYNVFIGHGATVGVDDALTPVSGAVAIGKFALVYADDTINIGASGIKVGIGLGEAPTAILDVGGDAKIGSNTNYIKIESDGDTYWIGAGSGLLYGFIEGDHIAWAQANAVQNTWYNISDSDIVTRFLNNVTHDGNGKMTVLKAGLYLISFNVSWEVDAANVHTELGIEVNGSGSTAIGPHVHTESKFANQEIDSSSTALMDLAANDTIEVVIRTIDAGTPNFVVDNVHLVCTQIGGT